MCINRCRHVFATFHCSDSKEEFSKPEDDSDFKGLAQLNAPGRLCEPCCSPPCSDSEEEFSEPEDDSDFDEVNSSAAKLKVAGR